VINYCVSKNYRITNLKLNKLLYFINIGYMLKSGGKPIFREEFQAWRHGPVLKSVYNKFWLGMVLPSKEKLDNITKSIDSDKLEVFNQVLGKLAELPAWQLVEMTHVKNGPWEEVYNKNKGENGICLANIPYEMIYHFYLGENNG